jgi:hypothetical protein
MYKMILLDDDEVRAESAARILRASGYEVQPVLAGDGQIEVQVEGDHVVLNIRGKVFRIKR